jgi:hypothetical protein
VGLNLQMTQSTSVVADITRLQPDMLFTSIAPNFFPGAFTASGQVGLKICNWGNDQVTAALTGAADGSKSAAERQAAWDTFSKLILDESPAIYVKGISTMVSPPYGPELRNVYMVKSG